MQNETHSRAKKGGEFGANGEWYEGGKFINTVPENGKRQKPSKKATRRQEKESGVWEVAPFEGMIALFPQLAGFEIFNRSENTFSFNSNLRGEWATVEYIKTRQARISAYNSGERWVVKHQ